MGFLSKSNGSKSSTQFNNALGNAGELPIQAKMRFGQANDAYEQEADRVADSVVNNSRSNSNPGSSAAMAPSISNYVQKQDAGEEKDNDAAEQKDMSEEKDAGGEKDNKEEESTAQKKEEGPAKEEEKPVQKKDDAKKEEEKPVQKKSTDQKDEDKKVQKKEDASKKDEEKPVQKKDDAKKEEEKPVQKKEDAKKDEEKPVQKKEDSKKDEEKPVQKKIANNPKAEEPAIEKQIMTSKEGGKPLEDDVRKDMEKQFGKDFRHVRIHNDPMAYELCRKISALAFTHGTHIYFAEGRYNPQAVEGKRLLAHELTHVVQQGGMLMRKMVQKIGEGTPPAGTSAPEKKDEYSEEGLGKLKKGSDGNLSEVELDHLNVPGLKDTFGPAAGEMIDKREGERPGDQVSVWESKVTLTQAASTKLDGKLNEAMKTYKKLPSLLNGKKIYFLKKKTADKGDMVKGIIMGSKNDVLQRIKRPQWDKSGKAMPFDVDHQKEIQLGGKHEIGNMWLLASFQNQDSGRNIKDNMVKQLNDLVKKAKPSMGDLPSGAKIKKEYSVKITNGAKADPTMKPNKEAIKYDKKEVEDGAQIDGLRYLSEDEIMESNLIGSDSNLAIYSGTMGGGKVDVPYDKDKQGKSLPIDKRFGNLTINSVVYNGQGASSTLNITLLKNFKKDLKNIPTFDAALSPSDAVAYGGVLSKQSVLAQLKADPPNLKYMSPFDLDFIELDENGLEGKGRLKTGLSLLDKLEIDIVIDENGIWLSKTFSIDEIKMPKPFKVDVCSFTIMLGTGGIAASGDIEFSIANIGSGALHGEKKGNGFALDGSFKLDEKICDGEVAAHYENIEGEEKWKIEGTVKFKKGAIAGVKSGSIKVGYDGKILTAKGDAELEAKWIEKGSLEAEVGEDKFRFTGKFTLGKMPGIESGDGEVTVEKTEGEDYQLKAKGKAKSSVKVVDTELSLEYDKGILTVKGSAAYSKGIMSGKIFVTVTNGPPPAEAPNPGGANGEFRVFGGGELTAQITPWLKGTIGVTFDADNQVIFSGKLAVTSPIEVFSKKEVPEKDLFSIGVDIPIFGIPVGPKTIGLKARIEGALVAFASIGPGTIEGIELGVTYNPDKPDDTHVTAKGQFVIPAEAGVKLAVRASIGLSALIGGVEGGIELSGGLKLSAKATADLNVDWSPSSGLELNALLKAEVAPKLTFGIDGFIKAWFAFYEKVWKWKLVSYEYGSELTLGVSMPIKYKQGEDFNVDFQKLQLKVPDISPEAVLGGVLNDIKNKRK